MSDLDLVRELFPERATDTAARGRVRSAVAVRTFDRRRSVRRRRLFVPALGLAAGGVTAVVMLLAGTSATVDAAAARVLRQAAITARQQPGLSALGPDQYLYTRSTDEYLNTYGVGQTATTTYAVMVPYQREVWLRRDGTGWLHQVAGTPRFLSDHDRQTWIDAGRPAIGSGPTDTPLQATDGPTAPMASLDLPSDPDALFAKLQHDAARFGDRRNAEMFIMIGDDLRENYTTPAQRAALFEAAARIPGIELAEGARDGAGRPADGVAIDDGEHHERLTLLFDPQTRALLGEEDAVLDGNPLGYPAGTVIGRAAYLEQKVVDSVPQSVVDAAKH